MRRRRWIVIAAVLLVATLSFGAYWLFIHTATNYLTVSEVKSQAESLYGQQVRVEGMVEPGSIDWDSQAQVLKFALIDNSDRLDVVYSGMAPEHFKPGARLVVEGRYMPSGEFEALSFPTRSLCDLCH